MKVAAIQMDIAWEQVDRNLGRAGELIERAADEGADLVVLPEMFATGFSMNAAELAEPPGGPIERFCAERARVHGIHLLGTKATRTTGRPLNTALLFGPGGDLLATQYKLHPFSLAGEHRHFDAGQDLVVTALDGMQVATAICYDLRFPEQFRALAFRGATLILVPANWPVPRVGAWSHLLVSRAIENLCYVVGVNRVGSGAGLHYDGCSAIVDPMGAVLATAVGEEAVVMAEIDAGRVEQVRADLSFLPDARRDLFPCLWESR